MMSEQHHPLIEHKLPSKSAENTPLTSLPSVEKKRGLGGRPNSPSYTSLSMVEMPIGYEDIPAIGMSAKLAEAKQGQLKLSAFAMKNPKHRVYPSTKDGVFYNLMAKPDIEHPPPSFTESVSLSQSLPEMLPDYESIATLRPPSYIETIYISSSTISELEIDGAPIGRIPIFFITCTTAVIFQFFGFLMCFILAKSHAGRLGAFAGIGLLCIWTALPAILPIEWALWLEPLLPQREGRHGHRYPNNNAALNSEFMWFMTGLGMLCTTLSALYYYRLRFRARAYLADTEMLHRARDYDAV